LSAVGIEGGFAGVFRKNGLYFRSGLAYAKVRIIGGERMFNRSKNPRVWRSLDKTATALFALLREKNYGDITISEVCTKAGLTRKTFYRDFDSLDDVVDFAVYARISEYISNPNPASFEEYLYRFFAFCAQRKEVLALFEKQGIYHLFIKSVASYLTESSYLKALAVTAGFNSDNRDYFWKSLVHEECAFVEVWIKRGFRETPEELVHLNVQLFSVFKNI
jgi:AcrR family transcriptional regulator